MENKYKYVLEEKNGNINKFKKLKDISVFLNVSIDCVKRKRANKLKKKLANYVIYDFVPQ